ncbi:hypothetical protein B0H17DRAFT_1299426 [Mycena rosella]|uniref:Uncharacterized protein n=1 Tax=Mycena rosella TaxID=1033263 RepID=A0AAD7DCQ0_MYCRO|nr:hypothetical protein B0H17DRAFT_1299426 [Mycena rosella]
MISEALVLHQRQIEKIFGYLAEFTDTSWSSNAAEITPALMSPFESSVLLGKGISLERSSIAQNTLKGSVKPRGPSPRGGMKGLQWGWVSERDPGVRGYSAWGRFPAHQVLVAAQQRKSLEAAIESSLLQPLIHHKRLRGSLIPKQYRGLVDNNRVPSGTSVDTGALVALHKSEEGPEDGPDGQSYLSREPARTGGRASNITEGWGRVRSSLGGCRSNRKIMSGHVASCGLDRGAEAVGNGDTGIGSGRVLGWLGGAVERRGGTVCVFQGVPKEGPKDILGMGAEGSRGS